MCDHLLSVAQKTFASREDFVGPVSIDHIVRQALTAVPVPEVLSAFPDPISIHALVFERDDIPLDEKWLSVLRYLDAFRVGATAIKYLFLPRHAVCAYFATPHDLVIATQIIQAWRTRQ